MKYLISILLVITFLSCSQEETLTPTKIVSLKQGDLIGYEKDDTEYFLGVPYAEAPVNDFRFKAPQSHEGWDGILNAQSTSKTCIQAQEGDGLLGRFAEIFITSAGLEWWQERLITDGSFLLSYLPDLNLSPEQSEDCLYLNIIKPKKLENGSLPVMVWIHGGGYRGGDGGGFYISDSFAKEGIILVTINYRLGPLGFMAHPLLSAESPKKVSGNYGTLDQIHALKWVQANIHKFGGDPNNVTIFGESAGGASVETLVSTGLAKDLFHKAIAQSGYTVGRARKLTERVGEFSSAEEMGESFAQFFTGKDNPTLEDLRSAPVNAFYYEDSDHEDKDWSWFPIQDGWVFSETTQASFTKGNTNDIIYVAGFNANEGTNLFPLIYSGDPLEEDWITQVWNFSDFSFIPLPNEVKQYAENLNYSSLRAAKELYGDLSFGGDGYFMASQYAKNGGDTYLYYFEKKPSSENQTLDATHGLELFYLFQSPIPFWPWNYKDIRVSRVMIKDWASIAKYGKPKSKWDKFDPSNPQALHYGDEIEFKELQKIDLYRDLERVYLREGKNY